MTLWQQIIAYIETHPKANVDAVRHFIRNMLVTHPQAAEEMILDMVIFDSSCPRPNELRKQRWKQVQADLEALEVSPNVAINNIADLLPETD